MPSPEAVAAVPAAVTRPVFFRAVQATYNPTPTGMAFFTPSGSASTRNFLAGVRTTTRYRTAATKVTAMRFG